MQDVDLGTVKLRQPKDVKEMQLKKRDATLQTLVVSVDLCQKCQHGVKKGEDLGEWLQCEGCAAPGTRSVLESQRRRQLSKLPSRIA